MGVRVARSPSLSCCRDHHRRCAHHSSAGTLVLPRPVTVERRTGRARAPRSTSPFPFPPLTSGPVQGGCHIRCCRPWKRARAVYSHVHCCHCLGYRRPTHAHRRCPWPAPLRTIVAASHTCRTRGPIHRTTPRRNQSCLKRTSYCCCPRRDLPPPWRRLARGRSFRSRGGGRSLPMRPASWSDSRLPPRPSGHPLRGYGVATLALIVCNPV